MCLCLSACKPFLIEKVDGNNMENDYLKTLSKVEYSVTGGSLGGYKYLTLERNGEEYKITYEYLECNGAEEVFKECNDSEIVAPIYQEIKDLIKNYDVLTWVNYPKSDLEILDAPTTNISIMLEDKIYGINNDIELKRSEDYTFFKEVVNLLNSVFE